MQVSQCAALKHGLLLTTCASALPRPGYKQAWAAPVKEGVKVGQLGPDEWFAAALPQAGGQRVQHWRWGRSPHRE